MFVCPPAIAGRARFFAFVLGIVCASLFVADAHAEASGNQRVQNFRQAKVLLHLLYTERPETLYSGCRFDFQGVVDVKSCGFLPRHARGGPSRIEWEHVVPAEAFGHSFAAWREGAPACVHSNGRPYRGRRCAGKVEAEYRRMESDLYNLVPEVDEINRRRANLPMGVVLATSRVEVLTPSGTRVFMRTFEPRDAVKGDVARTYLYMDDAYPNRGIVGAAKRPLFEAWSQQDPVDAWECRRAFRIEGLQGNENRFVRAACERLGLWPQMTAEVSPAAGE